MEPSPSMAPSTPKWPNGYKNWPSNAPFIGSPQGHTATCQNLKKRWDFLSMSFIEGTKKCAMYNS